VILLQLENFLINVDLLNLTLNFLLVALTGIYAYFVIFRLIKRKEEVTKRSITNKKRFFDTILEGLKAEVINKVEDIDNIYVGVGGSRSGDSTYRNNLSIWLKEFLVILISKEKDESIDNNVLREWNEKIADFINKIEETSPYSGLPDAERNILSDIASYLESNNKEDIERKLSEIAGILQARNEDFNRIKNTNKWAVPLAVVGMILTVVFGLISLLK